MFKPGNKVSFLDEVGDYVVIKQCNDGNYVVMDEHGFERSCNENDISLVNEKAFDGVEVETFENRYEKANPFAKKRKKTINIPVIDLHMEHLMDTHKHMANHEIVLFQLDVCKKQLDKHIEKGTTQLVIVHGVGKGKLKEEVRYLLNSYPEIEYMDEHFAEKGIGATKVFIK